MSSLTWITGKELKREIKQRKPISLEEKHENNIAVVRVCCTCKVVFFFLLIRNKSVLHVQSFFCQLEKKCAARAKLFFCQLDQMLLFFTYTVVVVFTLSLVLLDFIFSLRKL